MKNTKKKGIMRFVIFSQNSLFVGVCLDFNILKQGKDPKEVMESLSKASWGHLEVVRKEKLGDKLLNRYAPKKYWDIYKQLEKQENIKAQEIKKLQKATSFRIPLKQEFAYVA